MSFLGKSASVGAQIWNLDLSGLILQCFVNAVDIVAASKNHSSLLFWVKDKIWEN